jgi:putative MATE family efflux protein
MSSPEATDATLPGEASKSEMLPVDTLDRGVTVGGAEGITATPRGELPAVELDIWRLALPAVGSNLLHSMVGFVGAMAVGSLGASALAAVTAGERIFFILQAVMMALGAGTTALVARAVGAGDAEEAARVTSASMSICVGLTVVATIVGVLGADALAGIFELEAATLEQAGRYIRWLMAFNLAFAVFIVLSAALRAAGDTMTPLWIGAIANVLNVGFLFPFVYGSFGFPSLGVAGAALAGGLSFTLASALLVFLWRTGRLRVGVSRVPALTRTRVGRLAQIGAPAGLEQLAFQTGFVIFLWIVSFYGTEAYAAYGIGVRILSFSFVVGFGFSIAASTLVGQHLGAGAPQEATRAGWRGMRISIAVMFVFALLIALAAEPVARLMVDDDETVRLTVVFIYVLGSVQPLMAVEFALGGALRGAGDTRFPFIAVLIGMLGVRAGLAGLCLWLDLAVEWVFAALIGDYLVKSTMLAGRFRSGRWQHVVAASGPARN